MTSKVIHGHSGIDRATFCGEYMWSKVAKSECRKSDTSEDIFNPSSKQLTIRIIMSSIRHDKGVCKIQEVRKLFERDLPIHTILRGAWI